MTSPMPWIKLYTEILDDRKFQRLPDALKWRFTELCLLAGECDAEGYLVQGDEPMPAEDIAWRLRRQTDDLVDDLETLQEHGLIIPEDDTWFIVNFAKRQGRKQSEKRRLWRERKQRQRAKETSGDREPESSHADVTRESPVSPTPREEKSREEENTPPTAAQDDNGDADWLAESRIVGPDAEPPPLKPPADPLRHAVQIGERQKQNWADPPAAGGHDDFADGPVVAFCGLVGVSPEQLPDKKRNAWGKVLRTLGEEWGVGPPKVAECIRAIPDSEYHWKAYSSPYQDGFQSDLGVLIGQALGGKLPGATPEVIEVKL